MVLKKILRSFFLRKMNLNTKMQLSEQIESYWDLLPWHIASRIVKGIFSNFRVAYLHTEKKKKAQK